MELKLPLDVVSKSDALRLSRELVSLEDFFISVRKRQPGTPVQPPNLSRLLDKLAQENNTNLLDDRQRQALLQELKNLSMSAPVLHISFASEPSSSAVEKILDWLRSNIDRRILLQIGLQPSIAAGCELRTPNRTFDMSLRSHLKNQQELLLRLIQGAVSGS